jgi:hypothetical protein
VRATYARSAAKRLRSQPVSAALRQLWHHPPVATSRLRWALAQVGRKPDGAQSQTLLLEAFDLPGPDWTVKDERTWRTGVDATTDWQRRAKAAGCVTAWRSFEQIGRSRWLWIQATPLVDAADAVSALADLPARMLRNLGAKVRVVEEREVAPPAPLTTATAWAVEQRAEGRIGASVTLLLISAVGRNLVAVAGSGLGQPWTWDDIGQLAQRQATRLPE